MKILFLVTYYRPHWTGLTQYAVRLAEGLADKKNKTEVLCVQHNKSLPRKEIINNVTVYREPYLFRFSRSIVAPFFLIKLLIRLLKNEVVVIYLPFLEVFPATLISKLFRKKVYLVHNGDLVLPSNGGFTDRITERMFFLFTGESIKYSDGVIVQTLDYSRNSKLLSKFRKKWKLILPLYRTEEINANKSDDFKKRYNLKDKTLIGFSGRFVEEKGVDFLLDSIPMVLERIPNAHFVFAGEYKISYENYWEKINKKIAENRKYITLLGLVKSSKEIASFYKSLDVFVQPSRSDCFPSSLVEAQLYGIPAVVTDIPGARWIVKATKMGVVVSANNPSELAKGIIKIINNRKLYTRFGTNAKKIFNNQKTSLKYEKLFTS